MYQMKMITMRSSGIITVPATTTTLHHLPRISIASRTTRPLTTTTTTTTTKPTTTTIVPRASGASTAAAAVVASEGTLVRMATGVPLSDVFSTLTIFEAAVQSTILIGTVAVAVLFGNTIISFIGARLQKILGRDGEQHRPTAFSWPLSRLFEMILGAATRPTQVLLPWFGFAYCITIVAAFGELVLSRSAAAAAAASSVAAAAAAAAAGGFKQQMSATCNNAGMGLVSFLKETAQLMQDTSEIVLIIFAAWFFINFKKRLVDSIMGNAAADKSIDSDNLARIVLPVSSLITWAIYVAAILCSLVAFGIDIKPMLALGSVSTLAIGFAAQSTVANVVSAFSLYTSRPFIAGDRIQLKTMSGALVVSGTVQKILPMHTIIKTDNGTPIYIHNKDVAASLLVINESRILQSASTPPLPTIDTHITVRYKDVDSIPSIQEECTAWMKAHPDMLPGATCRCSLEGFDNMGPILSIKATLKRESSSRKAYIITEVLLHVEGTVRRHGGFLAMKEHVQMPPPQRQKGTSGDGGGGGTLALST